MDSSLAIRQRQPLHKSYAPRDPMPVRGVTATELDASKTVDTFDQESGRKHERERPDDERDDRAPDHAAPELLTDAESRELIYREQEAGAQMQQNPDQALMRLRAYSQARTEPGQSPPGDGKGIEA
jgi:hypothetical protein